MAGLNPHAGEHGLFGHEEQDASSGRPMAACRARGIDVAGPFPADTLFVRATRGEFDVVVACYHDQGLIPVKLRRVRAGGQRDARPADRADVGRSRDRVRHCRAGVAESREHDCGRAPRGALLSRATSIDVAPT